MLRNKFKISILVAYLLLHTYYLLAQPYRNSGFSKPMNLPFNLAGSFGEPRPDHFHSGIDIKTNGVEGEPISAIGDGYISRIRVSPYGYGKAIYITHTNGFTSVYGHLSRFYGKIEAYIHEQHYLLKKSELDLTIAPNIFPVNQNDTIAFSGNTGGSSAPHLHFEIRNTKTEHALNPLDFYPKEFYIDTIAPQLNKVKIYENLGINHIENTHSYNLIYEKDYLTTTYPINIETKLFGISIEGFDKLDSSTSRNGIYRIRSLCNNKIIFQYTLNEIDFEKTRMCNVFVDYEEMQKNNGYFYSTLKLPGNKLSVYDSIFNNGFINTDTAIKHGVIIELYDYNLNKTIINLKFNYKNPYQIQSFGFDSSYITKCKIKSKLFSINFPANSFYSQNTLIYFTEKSDTNNIISSINLVSSSTLTPLQKPASIEFKSTIKKNRNKIVMVRQNHKGNETALKTTFDKKKFYAETKELGTFYLKYDTTKPTIEISNLKSQISNLTIQAKIKDNLSGINTYNGYIDDQWVNFYYDAKNDVIQYNIDEHCTKGEHLLKIIVIDNVGNKTIVQQKFNY